MKFNMELPADITIEYDPETPAAYIRVKHGKVARTREAAHDILLDLDAKGHLLGIEVLDPKKISIKVGHAVFTRLAREFHLPELQHVHPEAIPKVYAAAA